MTPTLTPAEALELLKTTSRVVKGMYVYIVVDGTVAATSGRHAWLAYDNANWFKTR